MGRSRARKALAQFSEAIQDLETYFNLRHQNHHDDDDGSSLEGFLELFAERIELEVLRFEDDQKKKER